MYDIIDRPVTQLDHGGRFLVWSIRSWIKAKSERTCAVAAIAGAFGKWRMMGGLQPFLRMMALLDRHGLENVQCCGLRCNHVSEHEAIMIALVSSLRRQNPVAVRETIELLVEEEAVGNLLMAVSSLAEAMRTAEILPGRSDGRDAPTGLQQRKT